MSFPFVLGPFEGGDNEGDGVWVGGFLRSFGVTQTVGEDPYSIFV